MRMGMIYWERRWVRGSVRALAYASHISNEVGFSHALRLQCIHFYTVGRARCMAYVLATTFVVLVLASRLVLPQICFGIDGIATGAVARSTG